MKPAMSAHRGVAYTHWNRVTDLVMLLALAVIGVDFVCLSIDLPRLPYSNGAALLLCAGAFIGRNVNIHVLRCVVALTVGGLLLLRLGSGLFPELLPARHGLIGNSDIAVLVALFLLCGALAVTAFLQADNASPESAKPAA